MSEGTLAVGYIVTSGRIEATVNLPRQSVRLITRDAQGLECGSCEMFLSEWAEIGDTLIAVAEKLKVKAEPEAESDE